MWLVGAGVHELSHEGAASCLGIRLCLWFRDTTHLEKPGQQLLFLPLILLLRQALLLQKYRPILLRHLGELLRQLLIHRHLSVFLQSLCQVVTMVTRSRD